ncbi:hypothetical protein ACHQM5_027570 [Ranunculus cassubicifolius]
MYADDVLLFAKLSIPEIHNIKAILESYCQASGQQINPAKSQLIHHKSLHKRFIKLLHHSFKIPCKTTFPQYLGAPSILGRATLDSLDYLSLRLQSRLAAWKMNMLTKPGRETLIETVLTALPVHVMSTMILPIDLQIQNLALFTKKAWELLFPESLWGSHMKHKYFPNSSFLSAIGPSSSSKCWRQLKYLRSVLHLGLSWHIGDGFAIRAWKDNWIPFVNLQFPLIPQPINCNLDRVADFINPVTRHWNEELVLKWWPLDYAIAILTILCIPILQATALQAEALALKEGLKMLISLHIEDAIIEMDSKALLQLAQNKEMQGPRSIKEWIHDIHSMLQTHQGYQVQWNFREVNKAADAIANMASILPVPCKSPDSINQPPL